MSKVSIIVPIYKVERYIEKCIRSLTNQTFKDIEIWAISDGSPDDSMQIVKKIAQKDVRIKCIEKENGGYGSVLEYAIARIQTEYFLICDPDDWLEEDAIEKLYQCAEKYKVDLVIGERYLVYNNQMNKKINRSFSQLYTITSDKIYDNLENFVFMDVSPHSKLYKTNFARDIEFSYHINYTDTILYLIYLSNIKNAIYIDIPLSNYLIDRVGNSNGELRKFSQKTFDNIIIVLNTIFKQLNKEKYLYSSICYKLYDFLFFCITRLEDIDNVQLELNKKQIIDFLIKLKSDKENMKKYIKAENSLKVVMKKIVFELLFCDITRNITLNSIIFFKNLRKDKK